MHTKHRFATKALHAATKFTVDVTDRRTFKADVHTKGSLPCVRVLLAVVLSAACVIACCSTTEGGAADTQHQQAWQAAGSRRWGGGTCTQDSSSTCCCSSGDGKRDGSQCLRTRI
jgi:hypothetical protein